MGHHAIAALVLAATVSLATAQTRPKGEPPVGTSRVPNVYEIAALTAPQIDASDRDRTIFLLPIGTIEEYGPHLPVGMDSFSVDNRVDRLADGIGRKLPAWKVVLMPPIAYGEGGANEIGGIHVHPGTYGIRQTTLRAIVADVGGQIAQNGFKWLFVIHGHGGRNHNVAINEACDFVSETFGVTMLNLSSLLWADAAAQAQAQRLVEKHFGAGGMASSGLDLHAGWGETSELLHVRPDLVRPSYRALPSLAGMNMSELRRIASAPGWPGYFSDPAKATAAFGSENAELRVRQMEDLVLRALRGENFLDRIRHPEQLPVGPSSAAANKASLEVEEQFEAKLQRWLARKPRAKATGRAGGQ